MVYQTGPQAPGEYTTDDSLDADLGKTYLLNDGLYRYVKLDAAVTNAGGKLLVHTLTSGEITGAVAETTTASNPRKAGVIPIAGSIAATTTLALGTRLLVQLSGTSQVQISATTVTGPTSLASTTTAGAAGAIATTTDATTAVGAYIGYATNTAAAAAAGDPVTCVLGIVA